MKIKIEGVDLIEWFFFIFFIFNNVNDGLFLIVFFLLLNKMYWDLFVCLCIIGEI